MLHAEWRALNIAASGLPLLGGPRRPQKLLRVNIIPQIQDKVKHPPAPSNRAIRQCAFCV